MEKPKKARVKGKTFYVRRRLRLGISQVELGSLSGISQGSISKIENGIKVWDEYNQCFDNKSDVILKRKLLHFNTKLNRIIDEVFTFAN